VFQFLFRLSTDVRSMTPVRLLRRLVTGLANHYGATTCALHVDLGSPVRVAADADRELTALDDDRRARIRAAEQDLVAAVHRTRTMTSVLDIDMIDATTNQAIAAMGVMDVFAFPLHGVPDLRGVLVLYLPPESRALDEYDLAGLEAVGELLALLAEVTRERVRARA
jgi:hypothetical protein